MFKKYKEVSLNNELELRSSERRRKRLIVPIIYLLAEITILWLVLSLIQLEFDMQKWSIWAIIIIIIGTVYGIIKTVHVYERQKSYKDEKWGV